MVEKAADEIIRFDQVTLGYPTKVAIRDLSLSVRRGEFLGIIGPNGSGKSTLLKAILGLIRPSAGHIWVLGKRDGAIRSQRHRIGYLPQRGGLDPHFPAIVQDVVLMGRYSRLGLLRRPRREDQEAVVRCLEVVGMGKLIHEPFAHLSGGQQQRVLIARALVSEPEVLLLDEPTTAVDIAHQESIMRVVDRIHRQRGLSILMVTHDVHILLSRADRVAYLNGTLRALGSPEDVLQKESSCRSWGEASV